MFKRKSGIPVSRLVVVNTKDERSFVGWVVGDYTEVLTLRGARTLPGREQVIGDVVILRENVSWIQADVPAHMVED